MLYCSLAALLVSMLIIITQLIVSVICIVTSSLSISFFRRFGSRLWMDLFDKLLNVPSCDDLPSLEDFRLQFESEFTRRSDDYNTFVTASRNAALQCDC